MKYTKKRSTSKDAASKREATWEKFKDQQNDLAANRRGIRRKPSRRPKQRPFLSPFFVFKIKMSRLGCNIGLDRLLLDYTNKRSGD